MKPARFSYAAPSSVEAVIELHADPDTFTVLLAGGQSLMPLMNMRMAMPEILIDLNRVEGLDRYEWGEEGSLKIGAMVRQRTIENDDRVAARFPIIHEALDHVAHIGVRTRGTIGGTLCHAEPAAELPAVVALLGADCLLRGPDGERRVPVDEFFLGPMTTVIEEGEMLTGIEIPAAPAGAGTSFIEVARTHGAFALVGVAALIHCDGEGLIDDLRVTICGVAGTPVRPAWLAEMAHGEEPSAELFERIAGRIEEEIEPMSDGHADSDYRRKVAATLVARALSRADLRQEKV